MLRFMESWDHYSAIGDITRKGWTNIGAAMTTGRFGSGIQYTNTNQGASRSIDAQSKWIVGFAFKTTAWNASTAPFFRLQDGGTIHITLSTTTTGGNKIEVRRGAAGTVIATTTSTFLLNTWYYIELKILISDTVGTVDMQINGAAETLAFASGSNGSQDTRNGGNATADTFAFLGQSASNQMVVDDHYFADGQDGTATQGRANNDFLGDCRVQCILPSGNGNSSQLVGSDGNSTDNYLLVDEASSNTADYVESSNVGDKDTYAFGDVTPTGGTVYGVQISPLAAKTDAGVRQIVTVDRLSATEEDGAAATLTLSAAYYPSLRGAKPGGGPWSISDVNSAEFGVKISA